MCVYIHTYTHTHTHTCTHYMQVCTYVGKHVCMYRSGICLLCVTIWSRQVKSHIYIYIHKHTRTCGHCMYVCMHVQKQTMPPVRDHTVEASVHVSSIVCVYVCMHVQKQTMPPVRDHTVEASDRVHTYTHTCDDLWLRLAF
jgi:hypothetical protein